MTNVKINKIVKSFGDVQVIKNADVEIKPGELFFLLGPSGCGKTTLLRIIAGLAEPNSGKIYFNDEDVTSLPTHKRNTGMVFQNYALWPHMTVGENICFGLDVRKLPRNEKQKRVSEALSLVHLPGYENRYPHQLSGGQQQRVALARALVIKPDVVLLDEPLSNLDAGLREEMRREIKHIHKELGVTMIFVTHDQKEAMAMATRIAVMHEGKFEQIGSPLEIYQNPDSVFVAKFVGDINFLDGTVESISDNKIHINTKAGKLVCPIDRAVKITNQIEKISISIRPESISITNEKKSETIWQGTVVESAYLGEMIIAVCEVNGINLRITMLGSIGLVPKPGEKINLEINSSQVRIFGVE
ncbi:ABC transporter ATP-binding protein [bacterium]|nr:ABC transporter ATP-binding protein [bacterium]